MKTFRRKVSNRTAAGRSQRGASLPLSLFLFMICAILTSVVLSAGTAVAGRHSQLIETDQRYYSVASAAELLKTKFNDEVVFQLKTTQTSTSITAEDNTASSYAPGSPQFVSLELKDPKTGTIDLKANEMPDSLSKLTYTEQAALCLLLGELPSMTNFDKAALNIPANSVGKTIELEPCELVFSATNETINSLSQSDFDALKVNVDGAVQVDETLQVKLESALASSESGAAAASSLPDFSATVFFEPEITSEVIESDSATETKTVETGNNPKTTQVVETITDTTTSQITVKWSPMYITKAGA